MNEKKGAQKLIIDMSKIKSEVEKKLNSHELIDKEESLSDKYLLTGIPGFDDLFDQGIPKGANVLVVGSTGSGKTIFSLQTLAYHAKQGKNCLYMSFEEPAEQLIDHMKEFGWEPEKIIESGHLKIRMFLTSDIYYDKNISGEDVNAMIAKDSDSLLMDLKPLTIQEKIGFKPDIIVLDSLTAISSTFMGKEQSYRFYLERLFRFFKGIGATTLLITEIPDELGKYSSTGVEEFLADGVIVEE
jgi:circadian clock protein KaiC